MTDWDGDVGEFTESELRLSAGDWPGGESGAKLDAEDGGREKTGMASILIGRSIPSDPIESPVETDCNSPDEDELFRVCVRKWRVIMSRRQAE